MEEILYRAGYSRAHIGYNLMKIYDEPIDAYEFEWKPKPKPIQSMNIKKNYNCGIFPQEIIIEILRYADESTILSATLVNTFWHEACMTNELWEVPLHHLYKQLHIRIHPNGCLVNQYLHLRRQELMKKKAEKRRQQMEQITQFSIDLFNACIESFGAYTIRNTRNDAYRFY
jgi:hypothetical protein